MFQQVPNLTSPYANFPSAEGQPSSLPVARQRDFPFWRCFILIFFFFFKFYFLVSTSQKTLGNSIPLVVVAVVAVGLRGFVVATKTLTDGELEQEQANGELNVVCDDHFEGSVPFRRPRLSEAAPQT